MALNAKEVAELSLVEIDKNVRELRQELLELRLKKKTGQLEHTHMLKELRRDIARLETSASAKRNQAILSA